MIYISNFKKFAFILHNLLYEICFNVNVECNCARIRNILNNKGFIRI